MKKKNTVLLLSLLAFAAMHLGFRSPFAAGSARQVVDNMINAINKHQGVTFTMDAAERNVGKPREFYRTEIFTKVNINPLKIYGKIMKDPNKGTELLYVTGMHDNKVRVKAGSFLPAISLAPASGLLTKNQHHTLLTSGFMIVSRIVGDGEKRADGRGKFDEVFKYVGDVVYKQRPCYKVTIEDPTFTYTTAVGLKGETVQAMAKRLLVSEYHIMDLNPAAHSLDEDVSGKSLKVPTSYAKNTILYIDKETNFPLYQEMSDERGIFEVYEYSNVVVNPVFKADEFSEKNPEYRF